MFDESIFYLALDIYRDDIDGKIIRIQIREFIFEGNTFMIPCVKTNKGYVYVYAPAILEILFGKTRGGAIVSDLRTHFFKLDSLSAYNRLNLWSYYDQFTLIECMRISDFVKYHPQAFKMY